MVESELIDANYTAIILATDLIYMYIDEMV